MYLGKCPPHINDPMWYRWLAHLTLTQETGVRVPAWELFVPMPILGKAWEGNPLRVIALLTSNIVRGGASDGIVCDDDYEPSLQDLHALVC